jgi:hypothetical protein
MNQSRRVILVCYGLAVALACVWVPGKVAAWRKPTIQYFAGYSFLWSSPPPWKVRECAPALADEEDTAIRRDFMPKVDRERIVLEFGCDDGDMRGCSPPKFSQTQRHLRDLAAPPHGSRALAGIRQVRSAISGRGVGRSWRRELCPRQAWQ